MLYRDDYYSQDTKDIGLMEIIVGKNRNGSTSTCRVDFDSNIGTFNNLDKSKKYPTASYQYSTAWSTITLMSYFFSYYC